jgi:hypothetical protein
VEGATVGVLGGAVAVGEPGFEGVEFVGAEDDDGEDGDLGVESDESGAAFGDTAAEDGVGSFLDAAFGEDSDDLTGAGEGDGSAEGLYVGAMPIDADGSEGVEHSGEGEDVKFSAGEPGDMAAGVAGDEERLDVADVGDGQDETAGEGVEPVAVEDCFVDAAKAGEAHRD